MLSSVQSLSACAFIKKPRDSSFNQTVLTFNPITSISYNCWIWLDADDLRTAGAVTTWNDKSGAGNHCTQSTSANRPTIDITNLQNKRPTLKFLATSSQYLLGPTTFTIGTNSYYFFIVFKFNDTNTANWQGVFNKSSGSQYGRIWCFRNAGGLAISIQDNNPYISSADSTTSNTAFTIYTLAVNRNGTKSHILNKNGTQIFNGTITYTTPPNLLNDTPIFVGAHNNGTTGGTPPLDNSFLNGNIAEIIGYAPPTNMSVADIQRVEGYLAWKWGLQANLPTNHPHYSAQPT